MFGTSEAKEKFEQLVSQNKSLPRGLDLSGCEDIMPRDLCDMIDMPQGSTYAQGMKAWSR
jgi:hypothetical protein